MFTQSFPFRVAKVGVWMLILLVGFTSCQKPSTPSPQATIDVTPTAIALTTIPTAQPSPTITIPFSTPETQEETATPSISKPEDIEITPTSRHKAGLKCIGEAYGSGSPPTNTKDLKLQFNLPLNKNYQPVIEYFNEIAQDCDGLGLLGRYAEKLPWKAMIGELPKGLIFYSLPSLEYAISTANDWTEYVDWFAYEISFGDRTPTNEQNNPSQASQMAQQFAREHGLVYFVTPGRPMTIQHAEEIAQFADAYGLQAYGEQHESPATYLQLVKITSDKIRKVKPDILLFVAFSTDRPDDDPQVAYEMIIQLLGYIDGVFIRTSGDPQSMEKLQTLVGLLRSQ